MTLLGAAIVDVVIGLIIAISGLLSWLRGVAEELITILAWVLGLLVAFQYAEAGAQFVPETFNQIALGERTYGLTAFHVPAAGVVLFLVTFIAVSQLHRLFTWMSRGNDYGVLQRGDRFMGLLFGLLRGSLLVLVLVLIAGTTAIPESGFWIESTLIPYFVDIAKQVIEWMPTDWQGLFHYPEIDGMLDETLEVLPEADEVLPEVFEELPETDEVLPE